MNRKSTLNHRPTRTRRLFAVDIENVLGCGKIDAAGVAAAAHQTALEYSLDANDLVVIGVSHPNNVFPAAAWQGARIVMASGHDGADHALMRVLDTERVENRFDQLVLVSGDGIFADSVARLTAYGVMTEVRSSLERVSTRLVHVCTIADFRTLADRADKPEVA